jgi:hypothetical protein
MPFASIVYASGSGILRAVVYADTPEQLDKAVVCGPGEAAIKIAPDDPRWSAIVPFDQAAVQAIVDAERGQPADIATCAVIDNATGNVVGVIPADPALDSVDGHTLFPDANAFIGCAFDENGHAVPA